MDTQLYDFEDYAIRYGIKQPDGRTVLKDAFKNCDGETVPLVFNFYQAGGSHIPNTSPENVLGEACIENREDGVYVRCKLKDSSLVKYVKSLTIFARISEEHDREILSGTVKAVKVISR